MAAILATTCKLLNVRLRIKLFIYVVWMIICAYKTKAIRPWVHIHAFESGKSSFSRDWLHPVKWHEPICKVRNILIKNVKKLNDLNAICETRKSINCHGVHSRGRTNDWLYLISYVFRCEHSNKFNRNIHYDHMTHDVFCSLFPRVTWLAKRMVVHTRHIH